MHAAKLLRPASRLRLPLRPPGGGCRTGGRGAGARGRERRRPRLRPPTPRNTSPRRHRAHTSAQRRQRGQHPPQARCQAAVDGETIALCPRMRAWCHPRVAGACLCTAGVAPRAPADVVKNPLKLRVYMARSESNTVTTAEWTALFAEAAQIDKKGRVSAEETWISCRAARAAASKRAKEAHARPENSAPDAENGGAVIDFENGVWSVEEEDRYSGAGGRGARFNIMHLPE
jgi:hypothetical protein